MAPIVPEDTLKKELQMSDRDFKRNYLKKNAKWWKIFIDHHRSVYGGVYCAGCGEQIHSSWRIRNFGGLNYDVSCFEKKVAEYMGYVGGLKFGPTNSQATEVEWLLKSSRVMDQGLSKLAEYDYDEDIAEAIAETEKVSSQ